MITKRVCLFSTWWLLICLMVLLLFSGSVFAGTMTVAEVRESVVRIEVRPGGWEDIRNFDPDTQSLRGSGFVIGSEEPFQYVVTTWNNVNPDTYRQTFNRNVDSVDVFVWRSADDRFPARVEIPLIRANIAVLELDPNHLLYGYRPLMIGNRSMIDAGDDMTIIGYPQGLATARPQQTEVVRNMLSQQITVQNVRNYVMQAGTSIDRGSEGGPLINADGHVVGVAVFQVGLTGLPGGSEIDELIGALDSRGLDFLRAGEAPPAEEEEDEEEPAPPPPPPPPAPEPLAQVSNVRFLDDGILAWDPVDNADGYEVLLFKDDNQVSSQNVGSDANRLDLSETIKDNGAGSYSAKVKALGEGDYVDGPDAASSNVYIEEEGWFGYPRPLVIGIGSGGVALLAIIAVAVTMMKKKSAPAAAAAGASAGASAGAATQRASAPVTQAKPSTAPVTRAKSVGPKTSIKGISGHFAGKSVELIEGHLVIGRDPRMAQLVYPQSYEDVSRKHLSIRFDERSNKFILEDSSSNGTFLSSNQKLEPGKPYYLNTGERFYIADPKEVFELQKA